MVSSKKRWSGIIRRHRNMVEAAVSEGTILMQKKMPITTSQNVRIILAYARRGLNYSPATVDIDIFRSLTNALKAFKDEE